MSGPSLALATALCYRYGWDCQRSGWRYEQCPKATQRERIAWQAGFLDAEQAEQCECNNERASSAADRRGDYAADCDAMVS